MSHKSAHSIGLDRLRDHLRRIEAPRFHGILPFGVAVIDHALPDGGLPLGVLHEVLGTGSDEEDGAAAAGFVAGILARLGAADREVVGKAGPGAELVLWCLKRPDLYGPGLLAHGLDPSRVVLVRAPRDDDVLWAAEEALRTGPGSGLAAVVAELGRLPMVAGRRLQLAAERSGVTAFLLRRWRGAAEAAVERERPSAALTRWRVTALPSLSLPPLQQNPLPPLGGEGRVRGDFPMHAADPAHPGPLPHRGRGGEIAARGVFSSGIGRPRWRVELLRVRGAVPGSWEVDIADAKGHVRLSAGLADRPAAPCRPRAQSAIRRVG